MAQRRMISKKIIDTDVFLDMSVSARELYFQFILRADDEGFIANPKSIIKMVGSSDDDLKVLFIKSFVIPFKSGVCVITHWKMHNYIQKDRFQKTQHIEERKQLTLTDSDSYIKTDGNVSKMDTQVRLGKDSIGKVNKKNKPAAELSKQPFPKPTDKQKEQLALLKIKLAELDRSFDIFIYVQRINKKIGYFPPVDSIINIANTAINHKKTKLWGYFTNALKQEFPKRFAELNIEEHKKFKNEPIGMREIINNIGKAW